MLSKQTPTTCRILLYRYTILLFFYIQIQIFTYKSRENAVKDIVQYNCFRMSHFLSTTTIYESSKSPSSFSRVTRDQPLILRK